MVLEKIRDKRPSSHGSVKWERKKKQTVIKN